MTGDNVVQFPTRVNLEAVSELERRARQHLAKAITSAVEATWNETKCLELGELTADGLTGIMHRALDDVRSRFRWL